MKWKDQIKKDKDRMEPSHHISLHSLPSFLTVSFLHI